jgi:E3 SUMO-protein ligase NSE2
LIFLEVGDDSDDDDDVEVGGVTQDYKCPLTLTTLKDPMTAYVSSCLPLKSSILTKARSPCGHSFSAEAIRAFFKDGRNKKCPGAGCSKVYSLASLKPDKELAKKIQRAALRAQHSDDESDSEEVVE